MHLGKCWDEVLSEHSLFSVSVYCRIITIRIFENMNLFAHFFFFFFWLVQINVMKTMERHFDQKSRFISWWAKEIFMMKDRDFFMNGFVTSKLRSKKLNIKTRLFQMKIKTNAAHFTSFRPNPRRREKIKFNFYFHTSLWCVKRFYEGLEGLHKTFWRNRKSA